MACLMLLSPMCYTVVAPAHPMDPSWLHRHTMSCVFNAFWIQRSSDNTAVVIGRREVH